jgi:nitrate/nitrite transport system permease protein
MLKSEKLRALILSLLILGVFLVVWQIGTMPFTSAQVVDEEYAKLVGAAASTGQNILIKKVKNDIPKR